MTVPTFTLDLITQDGRAYSGTVESIVVPGEKGSFGVLANHAGLISTTVPGKLKIREPNQKELAYQVGNGFFEVYKNKATFLVSSSSSS